MKKRIPVSGHGVVQRDVMKMDINVYSKAVYCLLMSYKGDKNACFPSIKTITEDLRISKSTVVRSIKELELVGLVHVTRGKKENGDNEVNTYYPDLIYEELEVGGGTPQTPPSLPQTPPLVSQADHKNNIIKNNIEESLNLNAETSSANMKDLFGNEVKIANGIKSKPAKKKKESTAHPSHVEIKKYWYEEFSVGERFHPGAGKFINDIIANIESYISSMGGDTSPEKITEFFKVVCNQKILSKNSFVATAGLNVLSSPTNFKTIINSIENNGKSINQTGNRAGVTNFKFGYADPRKQQRQSDML